MNSGHNLLTNSNSVYADCHSKKLDNLNSPDVLIIISGSGKRNNPENNKFYGVH